MSYVCSRVKVTWYDGLWPSTSGEMVLLAAGEKISEGATFGGGVEQIVQRADYVRGAAPDFWVRGGRVAALEWDRVRPVARHDAALVTALETVEAMPGTHGWVLIELADYGRQWAVTPAAVRRTEWRYDVRSGMLIQRWSIEQGAITEIATDAEDDAWLWEDGTEILWEDETYMALETAGAE